MDEVSDGLRARTTRSKWRQENEEQGRYERHGNGDQDKYEEPYHGPQPAERRRLRTRVRNLQYSMLVSTTGTSDITSTHAHSITHSYIHYGHNGFKRLY